MAVALAIGPIGVSKVIIDSPLPKQLHSISIRFFQDGRLEMRPNGGEFDGAAFRRARRVLYKSWVSVQVK